MTDMLRRQIVERFGAEIVLREVEVSLDESKRDAMKSTEFEAQLRLGALDARW
jgi:hypothetical protein